MSWDLYNKEVKPKMALFVSKYNHCLYDILGRYSAGELNVEIPLIISNHMDLKSLINSIFRFSMFLSLRTTKNQRNNKSNYSKSTRSTLLFWPVTCKTPNLISLYENKSSIFTILFYRLFWG
jgi:formyltetrahydrofolate deformylase